MNGIQEVSGSIPLISTNQSTVILIELRWIFLFPARSLTAGKNQALTVYDKAGKKRGAADGLAENRGRPINGLRAFGKQQEAGANRQKPRFFLCRRPPLWYNEEKKEAAVWKNKSCTGIWMKRPTAFTR